MKPNLKALMGGFVVGAAVMGATFVLAHEPTGDSSTASGSNGETEPAPEGSEAPDWTSDPEILEQFPGGIESGRASEEPIGEAAEDDFTIERSPPDWILEACKSADPPTTDLHCKAIAAAAEGDLKLGAYSDAELREEVGQ